MDGFHSSETRLPGHTTQKKTACCARCGRPRIYTDTSIECALVVNAVFRFKALVGVKLTARKFENQRVEALVKCRVLNRMASLGMPRSERIQLG